MQNDEKEKSGWQVTDSEYLFRRPWLTVRRDRLRLPNGNEIPEYYVLEYPDWVNVLAVTTDQKFVFVRQYRHGLGLTAFELCAGVCEKEDSSPLESAQRELWEETGYGNGTWQEYMVLSANPSATNNLTHCFLATGVEPVSTQHLEPTEDLTVHLPSTKSKPCCAKMPSNKRYTLPRCGNTWRKTSCGNRLVHTAPASRFQWREATEYTRNTQTNRDPHYEKTTVKNKPSAKRDRIQICN